MNIKALAVAFMTLAAVPAFALSGPKPAIYVAPDNGFETDIIAGIANKHVPVRVVSSPEYADYILKANQVQIHRQTTGSKVVRCLFASCVGIQDQSNVAVQLLDRHTHTIVWGYNVMKADYAKKRQSMAEAIAKHLKHYLQNANKN